MPKNSPIIIIGMHRSGTSLVTRLLEELGLFVGEEKDSNNESLFFIRLNNWLLQQAGATWDNPSPFKRFLDHDVVRPLAVKYLKNILKSNYLNSYLGKRTLNNNKHLENLPFVWGWKDPRNTFTLPVWNDIFPNARIIHIARNGVDVAQSLKVRCIKDLQRVEKKWGEGKYDIRYRWYKDMKLRNLGSSVRSYDLGGGLSLWDEYLDAAQACKDLVGDRMIEIKYEDFLFSPVTILGKLSEFCELKASREDIESVVGKINTGRCFAFEEDAELKKFAEENKEILSKYGY